MDGEPVSFADRSLGPSFDRRVVVIGPGRARAFDDDEWRDALVVVESGELHLECTAGGRRAFGRGAVLWLAGLPLVALHNPGAEPVVLVAVARRRGPDAGSAPAGDVRPARARPGSGGSPPPGLGEA